MSAFELPILDEEGLPFATIAALSGRNLRLDADPQKADLVRALSIQARRFCEALNKAIELLEAADRDCHPPIVVGNTARHYDMQPLLEAFETCIFRAVELLEVFQSDFAPAIPSLGNQKHKHLRDALQQAVKSRRKTWGLICNRIKHNQNLLSAKTIRFEALGTPVFGFSLMEPKDCDALLVSNLLHKRPERARSVTLSLMQLVSDVIGCDRAAAHAIDSLPDDADVPLPTFDMTLKLARPIRALAKRPLYSVPNEKTMLDGFTVRGDQVHFARRQAMVIRSKYNMTFSAPGDGVTRTFEFKI